MRDKRIKSELDSSELIISMQQFEKKLAILSKIAEHEFMNCFIFEYDLANDVLTFIQPVLVQNRLLNSIPECTKMKSWVPLIHPQELKDVISFFSHPEAKSIEFRCLTKEGYQWFRGTLYKMELEDYSEFFYCGKVRNIEEEKQKLLQKEQRDNTDSLTGLPNLKYVKRTISSNLSRITNKSSSMVLIQLLYFNQICQRIGNMFADYILTQVAKVLNESFQHEGLIARIGEDTFLLYIKAYSSREELVTKLAQFCNKIASIHTGYENDMLQLILGVALYPQDGRSFDELFQYADTACYIAKTKGYGNLMFFENCKKYLVSKPGKLMNNYELPQTKRNHMDNYNHKIAMFAIEVTDKLKDIEQVIVVLLNYLVNVLNVDYARIYEVTPDHNYLKLNYSSGSQSMLMEYRKNIYEETGLVDLESSFENGLLKVDCTTELNRFQLKKSFYERGIYSTLQCGFYDDGVFCGCVALENYRNEHEWTKEENGALLTITKIFSAYLMKLRELDEIRHYLLDSNQFDHLTKLPLISRFIEDARILVTQRKHGCNYAVVSINFNNFKYINDSLGYEAGNQLLYQYARMMELTESILLTAREISDCFLLFVQYDDIEATRQMITEINKEFSLSHKGEINDWALHIKAGMCEVNAASDINDAIDKARIARKSIHNSYKTTTRIYDMEMHRKISRKCEIIQAQEYALKNNEFEVHLQPKIGLMNNQMVGAEALIRWNRADGNQMFPDEFIPIFEENGFILDVDFYVYETVCQLIRKWKIELNKDIPISVNVSRLHLEDENFVEDITELVQKYGIPPNLIEFELTETMVLDDVANAISMMQQLHERGFLVSIDDFGSGYSSLNLLKDLKTDILKLDRDFFRQGEMKQQDKIIVCNIINMAKQLNMKVLSEGVETNMQSQFLKENACDMAQGYLYARPMPVTKFEQYLNECSIRY